MPLRNPSGPEKATWVGGVAAVAAGVVSALVAATLAVDVLAAGTALDAVAVADGWVTVAAASTTATEVAGVGAVLPDVIAAAFTTAA
jgi:hypothetical protein